MCLNYSKEHRFPPERVELFKELSNQPDCYDRLARAIAPAVYENLDIKKGVLLQLLGGTKKTFNAAGRTHFRFVYFIVQVWSPILRQYYPP